MRREFGIALHLLDHARELIDAAAVGGRPAAPLFAVHRAEIAVLIGPFIPDADAVIVQIRTLVSPRRNHKSS